MSSCVAAPSSVSKVSGVEISLLDSGELYRQKLAQIMLGAIRHFTVLLDIDGRLLQMSQSALCSAGLTLDDVEGKPFWATFWWQTAGEPSAELRSFIQRAASGETIVWETSIQVALPHQESLFIEASIRPLMDDEGRVAFLVFEGRDITQSRTLKANNTQQKEFDDLKARFFANITNDLRTPLARIMGSAEFLASADGSLSIKSHQDSAKAIYRNANILLKQISDLIDISRFDAGLLKPSLGDIDLSTLVRDVASIFRDLAARHRIQFTQDIESDIVATVDVDKLQRVLMHLLSNAFKVVPEGGRVRMLVQILDEEIIMAVEDSGPGIDKALREVIFECYTQSSSGHEASFTGAGLGLAIAKAFIEMQGGGIRVLNSLLGGARFEVRLPWTRLSPASVHPVLTHVTCRLDDHTVSAYLEELNLAPVISEVSEIEAARSATKPVVLVVEGNWDTNQAIVDVLGESHHVISAYDGEEGIAKAIAIQPTLIITNTSLARMDGVQMMKEIRRSRQLSEVPFLVLTDITDEQMKMQMLELGAEDFVAKPFSEKELSFRVRNLIQLKASKERHRTLINSMDEGFCIIEILFDANEKPLDYRFLEVNAAFEKQTGLHNAEGRWMRELAPNHEQYWFDIYGKIALTGESLRFENRAEALNRWYEVYAFRVGRPEFRQVAILFNDISERKHTEEELHKANDRLLQADRAKDDFIAALSHELRTPLNPVLLMASDAEDNPLLNDEVRAQFAAIRSHVEIEARLIDDLLDITGIKNRKVVMHKKEVEIHAVLREAIAKVRAEIHRRQMVLDCRFDAPFSTVVGDPVRLQQVFWNILKNAVKFSLDGGSLKVQTNVSDCGTHIIISVTDTGIGMVPEEIERIFDSFTQGNHAHSGKSTYHFGGLGLGLSITRMLVELHSGTITAHSAGMDQGSTFTVELPLVETKSLAGQCQLKPPVTFKTDKAAGKGLRILLVEDHEGTRVAVTRLLTRREYIVSAACTVEEALAFARQERFDLVVSDIGLPDGDGFTLMSTLRKEYGLSGIALTGFGMERDVMRAQDAGFVAYLIKPVSIVSLEAALNAARTR